MRLLVVDDDPKFRSYISNGLRESGCECATAADGDAAMKMLEAPGAAPFDLILLDVMMPVQNGWDLLHDLRERGRETPVIFVTARDAVEERVKGLKLGADDYLAKPFAREELIARLRALLRRTGWEGDDEVLRFDELELDPRAHEARRGDRLLELTRTEFLLLELLMNHPRQVLTRSTIFDRVWGYDFGPSSNSLEVYVGYLRRKTEAAGEPRLLHTVRGVGYVLKAPRA